MNTGNYWKLIAGSDGAVHFLKGGVKSKRPKKVTGGSKSESGTVWRLQTVGGFNVSAIYEFRCRFQTECMLIGVLLFVWS